MAWPVTIGAGVGMLGYMMNQQASQNATEAETNAANQANATQTSQFNQTRADQQPFINSGIGALNQLNQQMPDLTRSFSMADFRADPGYQFAMDQGNSAIQRSSAARGTLGGDTLKSMQGFSQGLADQQYQTARTNFTNDQTNRFNKLSSMVGTGQGATNQVQAAGTNTANNISSNQLGTGNAIAANNIAQGNAATNALGTGMNTWMNYQMMNRYAPNQPQQTQQPPNTDSPY